LKSFVGDVANQLKKESRLDPYLLKVHRREQMAADNWLEQEYRKEGKADYEIGRRKKLFFGQLCPNSNTVIQRYKGVVQTMI
jgi:hypothetical protein